MMNPMVCIAAGFLLLAAPNLLAETHQHEVHKVYSGEIFSESELPDYVTKRVARTDKTLVPDQIAHFYAATAAIGTDQVVIDRMHHQWSSVDINDTLAILNYVMNENERLMELSKAQYKAVMCSESIDVHKLDVLEDIARNQNNSAYQSSFDQIAIRWGASAYEDVKGWMEKTTANLTSFDSDIDEELIAKGIAPEEYLSELCTAKEG